MRDPGDMSQMVASAHNILFHLALVENAPFQEPSDVVREFRDWAARNGHTVGEQDLQEMHVQSIMSLDERVAELVVEWARDVYPEIFA